VQVPFDGTVDVMSLEITVAVRVATDMGITVRSYKASEGEASLC
jgi:hypothetical protein